MIIVIVSLGQGTLPVAPIIFCVGLHAAVEGTAKKARTCGPPREHILYGNIKMKGYLEKHPSASRADVKMARSQCNQEWGTLSKTQKDEARVEFE